MPLLEVQYSDFFGHKADLVDPKLWYMYSNLREVTDSELQLISFMIRLSEPYEKLLYEIYERPRIDPDILVTEHSL